MEIDPKLIDKLLADYEKPEDIIGENGLLKQLTKALVERALHAELTTHLGYEKHSPEGHNSGALLHGSSDGPSPFPQIDYAAMFRRRTESGHPASIMRLRTATPTAASACWPEKLRARRQGLMMAL
jgi:hypothetical protein